METANNKLSQKTSPTGSALILTVVLTSLLAIVGVLFVLTARLDKMATSAISENRELDFAVDTVIAEISGELVSDVPGVARQEYYDYPGHRVNAGPDGILGTMDDRVLFGRDDRWLASLEPEILDRSETPADSNDDTIGFRHISDLYGRLATLFWDSFDGVRVTYTDSDGDRISFRNMPVLIIDDAQPIGYEGDKADADGDGAADSRWVIIPGITSSKGKPIYAAVRIVDNAGMLNVNTHYRFFFDPSDPNTIISDIDGSSLLQINLMALAGREFKLPTQTDELSLLAARAGYVFGVDLTALPKYRADLPRYQQNVIWRYGDPIGPDVPFDISDELELRNRFLVNHEYIKTRVENLWTWSFNSPDELRAPIQRGGQTNVVDWFFRAQRDVPAPNDVYSYRHIATTCNMDRIIDPAGQRMFNVNAVADAQLLHDTLRSCIDFGLPDAPTLVAQFAQLAANIKDYSDSDLDVSVVTDVSGKVHYGFEAQPFISEIAFRISDTDPNNPANNYFALELYNPFDVNIPLGRFRLELRRQTTELVSVIRLPGYVMPANSHFVVTNGAAASAQFGVAALMPIGRGAEDPNLLLATYVPRGTTPETYRFSENYLIYLLRTTVADPNLYLDQQISDQRWFDWDSVKGITEFYCRPDNDWNIVYQNLQPAVGTLGTANGVLGVRKNYNLARSMGRFITVGDVARMLVVGPSTDVRDTIGSRLALQPPEEQIRCDLHNPTFADIFQYLTVFDPASDAIDNDADGFLNETDPNLTPELKIPGRININTAPWFVIDQLPWVDPNIAQAIVAYRDKKALFEDQNDLIVNYANRTAATGSLRPLREEAGFASIGELATVVNKADNIPNYRDFSMRYYIDGFDQRRFPDLTTNSATGTDGAPDDFEERDLIFSRLSNLVTVRSDVFTAYILVRIGTDGPQKRVIAILDRSDVYRTGDKVRIIALHPVPDPR